MTMQRVWYRCLRWYVRLGLKIYYSKIVIHGRGNIPPGPVIFAANHQNAFMDALMIVCFNDHNTHFLTRSDIFKKPIIRGILNSLNMIPIYRIRDGLGSLAENQKTFDRCTACLVDGDGIVIFPEGNHGSRRSVRPISKGFTRIAFDGIRKRPELRISIVPVGLNYSDPKAFRSSVSVYFGKALAANDYNGTEASAANQLRLDVEAQLKILTTHIESQDRYEEVIGQLKNSNADFLDPTDANHRIRTILDGGQLTRTGNGSKREWPSAITAFSSLLNFIPLRVWAIIRKKIKDPVFIGSLKFGVGIFLFPAYYGLMATALYFIGGPLASLAWLVIAIPSMLLR